MKSKTETHTAPRRRAKRPKEKRPIPRRLALWGSSLLLLWSLLPLVANGIFGVGVVAPAVVAVGGLWWGLCRTPAETTKGKGWRKAMLIAFIVVVSVVAAAALLLSGLMIGSAVTKPREGATVIVLGSKIHGDRPSRMLGDRLRAAAAYLEADPTANCVVSGGLGEGETYTEAYVMKKYLVEEMGIDPERIACEDRSVDTHQNIHYSMEIIEEKGWSTSVAIATQVFHQYRAGSLARMAGADSVGGVACLSPLHLMLNYWVRECAAIFRLWILGY